MSDLEAPSVKLFVAILWSEEAVLKSAIARIEQVFSTVDFVGEDHAFDATSYYEEEMGDGLKRRLIALTELAKADRLTAAKIACRSLEDEFRRDGARQINLDIGYIDACKIVLASFKGLGQKLYLSEGVWADFVARYKKGSFQTFEWSFPDFKDGRYERELLAIRALFMKASN